MPLNDFDAPFTGGYAPGGRIFAVDGDFSEAAPHGPPEISYPMSGDSIVSNQDVIVRVEDSMSPLGFKYTPKPVGNRQNFQPWAANQKAFVIDQRFRVAAAFYQPLPLNTPYDPAWAEPWLDFTEGDILVPSLASAYLVKDGATRDCGGGIVEFERRFASIPPTHNETEQISLTRISFGIIGNQYDRQPVRVMSRLQFDYFIFDELDILNNLPLFTDLTHVGVRLNSATGLRPPGLIMDAMKFYGITDSQESAVIFDATANVAAPSTPSLSEYESWMANGNGTSNGLPAEMVIEASTFNRYMGNIIERVTRFAEVQ
jgi:hypothetical protein